MTRLAETLGITWPVEPAEVALAAHLPDGSTVTRWTDPARWQAERERAFGPAAEPFWRWQEETAAALWEVALRGVPWPPQTVGEVGKLAGAGLHMAGRAPLRMPGLAADAFRPLGAHLHGQSENLRRYVDGQLLIAAQATSPHANALYGAAALDMPRRGVAHVRGGIGKLAETLVDAVRRQGGQVLFRQRVTRVSATDGCEARRDETRTGVSRRTQSSSTCRPGTRPRCWARLLRPGYARRRCLSTAGARSWSTSAWTGASCPPIFRCTTRSWSGSRSAKGTASFSRSACPTMPPGARRASVR